MSLFITITSLLVVITVALLFLPLLRSNERKPVADASALSMQVLREQMQDVERALAAGEIDAATAEKEKRELERRALEENAQGEIQPIHAPPSGARQRKWFVFSALVAVPLVAGGLYWLLGNPDAMAPEKVGQATADHAQGGHAMTPQQIEAMTARLAERLASNPADGEGWMMLARSYAMMGRHGESAAAFGRAVSILPPNAGLYADYADVLAMAQGRRLAGEPEKIIAKALELEPTHIKALALSGSVGFEAGDYRRAVSEWQKILLLVPPESNLAQSIKGSIADAQSRLGTTTPIATAPAGPVATAASISGTVAIAPEITAGLAPTDTVFVFARAVEGSRMPLALRKMTVAQLPADFTLDDSMAMSANAKLSGVKQVVVGARISKSGGATPRPGDFEGFSPAIAVGSKNVKVVIAAPVK